MVLAPATPRPPTPPGRRSEGRRALRALGWTSFAVVLGCPLLGNEVTLFKAGLVLTFFVAAIGLHITVNWAGQLSLAHASLVGLPAFSVLAISERYGISPVYLVPVAAVLGAIFGGALALPTLRARGLHVALVTLAAGVAVDRYFFTSEWLVGRGSGKESAPPMLGPVRFETSRQLYVVLAAGVVLAVLVAWLLLRSKVARAWAWVKADPVAAAAFGIPVAAYRVLAFAVGGAFAGFAGGLFVMWIQRLNGQSFPTSLSFSYLLVVVLGGPGFVGGTLLAVGAVEGGRLFSSGGGTVISFAGPVGLVVVITRYAAGLNGYGRALMDRTSLGGHDALGWIRSSGRHRSRRFALAGAALVAVGFVVIGTAWYQIGQSDGATQQNQLLLSGGFGGLALVLTGVAVLLLEVGRRVVALLEQLTVAAAAADLPVGGLGLGTPVLGPAAATAEAVAGVPDR